MPGSLVVKQIGFDGVLIILLGLLVALLYRTVGRLAGELKTSF